ncbi:MAG: PqqD family protein [Vicinamibacterales bacterium]
MPTSRFALAPDVLLQQAGGETLLVKLSAEDMFALDEIGAEIVRRLDAGNDLEAVVDDLTRAYDAPAGDVARDIHQLVEALVRSGLLLERGDG